MPRWSAETDGNDELETLWLDAKQGYGFSGDGALLRLSQVSALMDGDDACAVFFADRAGVDDDGSSLVSEVALKQFRLFFGPKILNAVATLREVTTPVWFLSSRAAFEQEVKSGSSAAGGLFGACFGEEAPQYLLLSCRKKSKMTARVLLQNELELAVGALQGEGYTCISEIRWTGRLAYRMLQKQLRYEAQAYGSGHALPPCIAIDSLLKNATEPLATHAPLAEVLQAPSDRASQSATAPPVWTLLSGHSYRFVREVHAAFPDATRANWTGLLQWALSLPSNSRLAREEKEHIFSALSNMFIQTGKAFAKR